MISIAILVFSIAGGILLFYGYRYVIEAPVKNIQRESLKLRISIKELGQIEGGISNLKEVIVIADRIEEPTNELYGSVKENFKKNVKYTFLVSKDSYENEKSSYFKIFEGIKHALVTKGYPVRDVSKIYPLNFEWEDYPYIFYRFSDASSDMLKVFAYMGTQVNEGIADDYELIPPTIALKILKLAFDGTKINENEMISPQEVYNADPLIIPISKAV